MHPGVAEVKPLENYKLLLTFENKEQRIFDLAPYLNHGNFAELKNEMMFRTVRVNFDSIEWQNGLDLCPEILFKGSVKVQKD